MHLVHRVVQNEEVHNQETSNAGEALQDSNQEKPVVITLDSATTKSLFCNEELVDNRWKSKYVTEIGTNAGTRLIDEEADVPDFREVMFSEEAIANLFSLNKLCERYRVEFDSDKENAFIVHLSKDRRIKFPVNSQGLYTYNPLKDQKGKEMINNIATRTRSASKKVHVEGYTPREVQRAKAVRRLYHSLTAQEIGEL